MRLSSLDALQIPPTNAIRKYNGLDQDPVTADESYAWTQCYVRNAISQRVRLSQGYFVQYAESLNLRKSASRQILLFSIVAIAGIFLLIYIALKSVRSAFLVMANLPLALIGGVVIDFTYSLVFPSSFHVIVQEALTR
jgi:Cu/Ag efflux pump CusA